MGTIVRISDGMAGQLLRKRDDFLCIVWRFLLLGHIFRKHGERGGYCMLFPRAGLHSWQSEPMDFTFRRRERRLSYDGSTWLFDS